MLLHLCQVCHAGRQSKVEEDAHEVREARTNWNLQVWAGTTKTDYNQSVSHFLQDSNEGNLQKKLMSFVMQLNTRLTQEKDNPQEPGPDI